MNQYRKEYIDRMVSRMGSTDYIVFLNGRPQISNNSYVFAKVVRSPDGPNLEFFIKYKVEGKSFTTVPPTLMNSIMTDLTSGELFGYNFSNWLYSSFSPERCGVYVNDNLRGLFLESPMYTIFRQNIPKRNNLAVEFSPVLNDGTRLDGASLLTLLNRFRVNGFQSIVELERSALGRRIYSKTPRFYRRDNAFTLAGLRLDQVYNPLFDDQILFNQLKGTRLLSSVLRKMVPNELGVSTAFLSNHEASRAFGLEELVPFDFKFIMKLVGGFVIPPAQLPLDFPSKNLVVARLAEPTADMARVLSAAEFLRLPESLRDYYVESTSLRAYVYTNLPFFRNRGFRSTTNLISILDNVELLPEG